MSAPTWTVDDMAALVAADIEDGAVVNLGIGLPVRIADHQDPAKEIIFHSENGIVGMGPAPAEGEGDPDLINASKQQVTLLPGAALMHHTDSFVLMRGGHIDLTVLGAFEVSAAGDLANWSLGDATEPPAIGGAMDLVAGARRVFVMTTHVTRDGSPKLRTACTLPLTGAGVVDRVYTDLAIIDVSPDGFVASALVEGVTREEVQARTDAPLAFAADVRVIPRGFAT